MGPLPEPNSALWPFPFTAPDWEQTPPSVQAYLHTLRDDMGELQERVESLEARLNQTSTTSSRPPSSDSLYKKPQRRSGSKGSRQGGGKAGHEGHRQVLFAPTTVEALMPKRCPCGRSEFGLISPSYTHQVIELPPIEMEVTHWVLHQGRCQVWGRWCSAQVPAEQATGYGPRFRALMGELAGSYGNGRRMVQGFCTSVLRVPISLGAIQKVLDRLTLAIARSCPGIVLVIPFRPKSARIAPSTPV